jgi:hypothetical protein
VRRTVSPSAEIEDCLRADRPGRVALARLSPTFASMEQPRLLALAPSVLAFLDESRLPEPRSPRGKQHVGLRGKDAFEPAAVRPDRVHLEPAVEAEEAQEQDAPSGR